MKISALTTCVGPKYAAMLHKSLPIWLETCDEVIVVTDLDTKINWKVAIDFFQGAKGCTTLIPSRTDIFTAHGASFNKGAALSHGFAKIKDPEWVLNFDADILPPPD